jgi:hypothetical protein
MYLGRFELIMVHVSAKKDKLATSIMFVPDTLSQGSKVNIDDDNANQILLPKHMFVGELIVEEDLRRELALAMSDPKIMDMYFITIWKILKKGTSNKYPEYKRKNDLLYYKDRLYIPHGGFRKDLMHQYHNHTTAGHPGQQGTLVAIS